MTKYELPVGSGVVSDLDRKEGFVDASDIQQQWSDEWGVLQPALTDEVYENLLINRGKENVIEPSEELTASIDMSMYEYGKDFFLGDILTIYNETLGAYSNKRLIGMDRVDEDGGRIEPVFEE